MSKVLRFILLIFAIIPIMAQVQVPYSHETVTFDNTSGGIGFTSTTLTVNGRQMQSCVGILETAAIRFYTDGTAPTTSNGSPLAVGQFIKIDGFTALIQFRGIRTTSTSGVIQFTCSR